MQRYMQNYDEVELSALGMGNLLLINHIPILFLPGQLVDERYVVNGCSHWYRGDRR